MYYAKFFMEFSVQDLWFRTIDSRALKYIQQWIDLSINDTLTSAVLIKNKVAFDPQQALVTFAEAKTANQPNNIFNSTIKCHNNSLPTCKI